MPHPRRAGILALLVACVPDPVGEGGDTGPAVPRGPLQFALPVAEPDRVLLPVMGLDHDPEVQEGAWRLVCTDYLGRGFPHCYDGHDASDFLLDGGFEAMDAGSATVLAAAAGTVEAVEDGHYDRCHGDLATLEVDCDGHEMVANAVTLLHEGGVRTRYLHFMAGSILVSVGEAVEQGAPLGLMGSSGISSAPHLHFAVEGADGADVDPYAGPESQPETWWCDQGDPDGLPGGCG